MISIEFLTILLVFSIPILGIGLAGYQEWLKFRAKQQELGASTKDVEETISNLEERLEAVERERDGLIRRVQNLETIVTSEAWDALAETMDEPVQPLEDKQEDRENLSLTSEEEGAPDSSTPSGQASALARRLRE